MNKDVYQKTNKKKQAQWLSAISRGFGLKVIDDKVFLNP